MNKQQLFENIKRKKSFLCVGLDTDIKKIPTHLLNEELLSIRQQIFVSLISPISLFMRVWAFKVGVPLKKQYDI